MRIIIFLLFSFLVAQTVLSQEPTQQPTKKELTIEIQKQIADLKKEIAEVEKQIEVAKKEDTEAVKDLEQQLRLLKQQLATIEGVYKGISGMSEKTFHDATTAEEENNSIPKRDIARISTLPKKILSDAEMISFVRTVNTEVEKIIPPAEKSEALKIYNETKAKYNSTDVTGNAASGCWMYGHWEKALYIMGRACLDDMTNTDNLNNYAAFLSMTGAEQAALPILQWLNKKYPKNSTILNNIGQAWFGLRDLTNSKKYLDSVTSLYGNHSMANATLSKIYESEGDSAKAISSLKKAIRENYDPEKEHELERLGVSLTYADMPEFNYPIKKDPFGFLSFINLIPEEYPSKIEDKEKVYAIDRFVNGVKKLDETLKEKIDVLSKKIEEENTKLVADSQHRVEFQDPYKSPAYNQAIRSLQLLIAEKSISSALPIHLLFPLPNPFADKEQVISPDEIIKDCINLYEDSVLKPTALLSKAAFTGGSENPTCAEVNARWSAYLEAKADIERNGAKLIKEKFIMKSRELDSWIRYELYGTMDESPPAAQDLTDAFSLISYMQRTIYRERMLYGETLNIIEFIQNTVRYQSIVRDNCRTDFEPDNTDPGEDDLAPLVVPELKCEFIKNVKTPVGGFTLRCNTINYNSKSKIENKKNNVPRGQAQNSKSRNRSRGPLNNGPRGPSSFLYEFGEPSNTNIKSGPLNAEDKDLSQFSIEYDKWGNLVGLNVQLNEDGTALADPDSQESGIDSRWSWNAAGSPVKGFLNKLLIRKP